MKTRKIYRFVNQNKFAITFLLVANFLLFFPIYFTSKLNGELALEYSTYQDKGTSFITNRLVVDEITNAINIATPNALNNLNSMGLEDFNNFSEENKTLTEDYKNNKIKFISYWNDNVLTFYNSTAAQLASSSKAQAQKIIVLNNREDFWSQISLLYSVILTIVNIFISILLAKRFENLDVNSSESGLKPIG